MSPVKLYPGIPVHAPVCPASPHKSAIHKTSLALPELFLLEGYFTVWETQEENKAQGKEEQIRFCWQNVVVKVNTFNFLIFSRPSIPTPVFSLQCPLRTPVTLRTGRILGNIYTDGLQSFVFHFKPPNVISKQYLMLTQELSSLCSPASLQGALESMV